MNDSRGAIQNLLYIYAELLDSGNIAGLADLLADAEITVEAGEDVRAERVGTYRGRDEIFAFYGGNAPGTGSGKFLHVTANSIIEIDDAAGSATARSYYTVLYPDADGRLAVIVAGKYRDRFIRGPSGWRFAARTYVANLSSSAFRALPT